MKKIDFIVALCFLVAIVSIAVSRQCSYDSRIKEFPLDHGSDLESDTIYMLDSGGWREYK